VDVLSIGHLIHVAVEDGYRHSAVAEVIQRWIASSVPPVVFVLTEVISLESLVSHHLAVVSSCAPSTARVVATKVIESLAVVDVFVVPLYEALVHEDAGSGHETTEGGKGPVSEEIMRSRDLVDSHDVHGVGQVVGIRCNPLQHLPDIVHPDGWSKGNEQLDSTLKVVGFQSLACKELSRALRVAHVTS